MLKMMVLYLVAIIAACGSVWILYERFVRSSMISLEKELRETKARLLEQARLHQREREAQEREISRREKSVEDKEKQIQIVIDEKTRAFPWLSTAIADFLNLRDGRIAAYLMTKSHPARNSAEEVRRVGKEKRALVEQLNLTRYRLKYYETLFPYLIEYVDADIDDELLAVVQGQSEVLKGEDPAQRFMTQSEYRQLPSVERNQLALDRYLKSRRPWQIGRDYERYVGNHYERQGYRVTYHGIEEGLEDLGRDLICVKSGQVLIVQCKCWSSQKKIHEKHVNQLFGTSVKYFIDRDAQDLRQLGRAVFPELLRDGRIKPVLWTSTVLSDTAKKFAEALGVEVHENELLKSYPLIKCHTSKSTGEKIYHLPFDQMYDKTVVESRFGEFYATTVKEAEDKGFRRAWRWQGE